MRRPDRSAAAALVALAALVLMLCGAGGAAAAASPALAASAPRPLCALTDDRLSEVSGMVSDGTSWYMVNDGGSQLEVFVLNKSCAVTRVITGSIDPYDVEDLARTRDGTLWLADTGDNNKQRETVALHKLTPDGRATLYRLTYPDGQHDAEALLVDRAGVPYVITKNVLGQSEVFRPDTELRSPGPTPLVKVAELALQGTDTQGGPVGATGSVLVTGGATSADGSVVALRTYTDAYLYAVPDGDVAAALSGEPVRVPLPAEEQGEAIALAPNGALLSVSEGTNQRVRFVLGATALVNAPETATPGNEKAKDDTREQSDTPKDGSGLATVPAFAVAAAVVAACYLLVTRIRRRR